MRNVRLVPFAPNCRRPSLNSSRSDFYLRTLAKEEMWRWPDLEKSDSGPRMRSALEVFQVLAT